MTDQEKRGNGILCERNFEIVSGVILAFLAAALAITDLAGGNYSEERMVAHNQEAEAFNWYNSKSIKQTMVESQAGMLEALIVSGTIENVQVSAVQDELAGLNETALRYSREKVEILEGSTAVGEENWMQDVDGELGKVIGANEWKALAESLSTVGDIIDNAVLFLQLSLVLGAIALVFQEVKPRMLFFYAMVGTGSAGMVISIIGIMQGLSVG